MLSQETCEAVASGFWLVYCRMKQRGSLLTAGKDRHMVSLAEMERTGPQSRYMVVRLPRSPQKKET